MSENDVFEDIARRCLAMRVHRASRLLTRRYDEAIRETGLTITQFTLLNTIASQAPQSISEIGSLLDIDRTTLSRSLSLMEKAGLVRLGEPGTDRRRGVSLTWKGRDKLKAAYEQWKEVQTEVEALYEPDELDMLKKALSKIRPDPAAD